MNRIFAYMNSIAFKVQNWAAYEAGLRRRGSLTLWIEDGALEHWQTCGPDGQARYTDAAIQTSLMVRTAFKLALRQTEGLMASVLRLMELTISAPDHTTVSRRAVALPVIQAALVSSGPLHVLIDSTGLQVFGAVLDKSTTGCLYVSRGSYCETVNDSYSAMTGGQITCVGPGLPRPGREWASMDGITMFAAEWLSDTLGNPAFQGSEATK